MLLELFNLKVLMFFSVTCFKFLILALQFIYGDDFLNYKYEFIFQAVD